MELNHIIINVMQTNTIKRQTVQMHRQKRSYCVLIKNIRFKHPFLDCLINYNTKLYELTISDILVARGFIFLL